MAAPVMTESDTNRICGPQLDWATKWLENDKLIFINGQWVASSGSNLFESKNPANAQTLALIPECNQQDVDQAVAAARSAFEDAQWRKMTRRNRAALLQSIGAAIRKHHAELATLETLSNGKLYTEAYNDDIPEAADVFDYYAGWTDKFYAENCPVDDGFVNYTVREPLGVCGLIVPWNFPLLLACWKLAPALAMGNTVVIKPSPYTSLTLIKLMEILQEENVLLAPGVINLVTGGAEAGNAICHHRGVNKVSFTGSTKTGKQVLSSSADSNLKTVTLELGGKSPNIVFEDVPDLQFAIKRSYEAMFSHKGEKCSEPTRLIVHHSIYEQFIAELAKLAEQTVCGDPFDPKSTQGAQCNEEQLKKVMHYISSGKKSGFRLVAGGNRDTSPAVKSGYFVRPTIFADVDNNSEIAQDEIFGPVLAVTPFTSEDEAVQLANDTQYGLAAGLWTGNVSRAHRVAQRLDAGMVFVNKYGMNDFASPFGGFKQSGWGKEMARHSLEAYTRLKSVWLKI